MGLHELKYQSPTNPTRQHHLVMLCGLHSKTELQNSLIVSLITQFVCANSLQAARTNPLRSVWTKTFSYVQKKPRNPIARGRRPHSSELLLDVVRSQCAPPAQLPQCPAVGSVISMGIKTSLAAFSAQISAVRNISTLRDTRNAST